MNKKGEEKRKKMVRKEGREGAEDKHFLVNGTMVWL